MKCILCGKEFPDNISDLELFNHFIAEHKKEVQEVAKSINMDLRIRKKRNIYKSVKSNVDISKL